MRLTNWLILVVLLAAFALRLWHLDTESIWHDEAWSIRAIHGPFTTPDDNTPFVYYLSGHLLWRLGGGDTPLALRYISVLIGVLTVAAALHIGRRWYGAWAGLTVGVLVASSPLLWEYAQEIRAYVAVPLVALALLAGADALLRADRRASWRAWAVVFAAELVGIYTHNLAVPLVVWLNVALGVVWLLRRDWRSIFVWAGWQIALIVAYVPWLLTQSPSGTPLNTPPEPGLTLIRDVWRSYFLPALPQLREASSPLLVDGLGVIVGVVMVMGTVWWAIRRSPLHVRWWLLLSHVLLVPVFTTALMLAANIDFHPRYYIAAVPATLLALVAGVMLVPPVALRRNLFVVVAVIALAASAGSIHQIRSTRTYQHDDFAALAAYYDSLPADAVILIPFDDEPALQYYYDRVLEIDAQFVNVPLYSDEASASDVINALDAAHVELLTWFQVPADQRGMYPCLLTAASTAPPGDSQTYFGLMTWAFTVDDLTMQPLSAAPAYRTVNLRDAAYGAGGGGACLRTIWTLDQTFEQNLKVAAAIRNPFGAAVTRSDAEIARPDNTGTAAWDAGAVGTAYNLLMLPAGAPRADYTLAWNLYTPSRTTQFDLLDDAGNPAGVEYRVPEPVTLAGPPLNDLPDAPEVVATSTDTIQTGVPFDLALILPGTAEVTLTVGEVTLTDNGEAGLGWYRFQVPPGNSGEAVLRAGDAVIARYPISDPERQFTPPGYATPADVTFSGVGRLVGVDLPAGAVSASAPPEITLVWQAAGDVSTAYTVFVQLLTPEGQVIAQSDQQPAGWTRPTTSWIEDEYIADTHLLDNWSLPAYSGTATVIVGLYDAQTGFRRVPTADGADSVTLPGTVRVSP